MDSFIVPRTLDTSKQKIAVLVRNVLTQISCLAKALFGLHAAHNALQSAMFKLAAMRPIR